MEKDKSVPPPARPLSKEDLTFKVKQFPVNYGASIVGKENMKKEAKE